MPSLEHEPLRKRKAHTKSRRGCENCKLRRVKCDESKPACKKCTAYQVSCSYDGQSTSQLQLPGESAFVLEQNPWQASTVQTSPPPASLLLPQTQQLLTPPSDDISSSHSTADDDDDPSPTLRILEQAIHYPLQLHDTHEVYTMTPADITLLKRFRTRTVLTMGTAESVLVFRDAMFSLGWTHTYLTHIILVAVLMHDRYLSSPAQPYPSTKEAFHHYHGTAILNSMLFLPLVAGERDAMWGTAALLGAITIASLEAMNAEDCWPLKPPDLNDLDWLRMSDGKKEVWRLAEPLREESIWRCSLAHMYASSPVVSVHPPGSEVHRLTALIGELYSFAEGNPPDPEDPYRVAASLVTRLLPMECTHSTIMHFLSFIGHIDPAFRVLLHEKDARALLLLAWWYAMVVPYEQWWLRKRVRLECQAICIWLGREHAPYSLVGRMLEFPRARSGLLARKS